MKIHTTISLDEKFITEAKEKCINLSGTINTLLERYFKAQDCRTEETKETGEKILSPTENLRLTTNLDPKTFNEMMDLAKGLWASEIGKEILLKSRDRRKKVEEEETKNCDGPIFESNREIYEKVMSRRKSENNNTIQDPIC
jgi:hypothetical protein